MLETERIANNKNKLMELYPAMRVKVDAILKGLEGVGYRPRIQTAWRSEAEQLDAYKRGTSRVQYGFHNVTGANGVKEALAVDVWDDDNPTTTRVDFMLRLAAAAEAQGLTTGIRWDLADEDSVLIDIALQNQNWDAKIRVGWDPLHVEPVGITIEEAKVGKRPVFQNQLPGESEPPAGPSNIKRNYRVQDLDNAGEVAEYKNWTTAFKPVTLLPVPYVSQLGPGASKRMNDCGAACAVMLMRAYTNTTMTPDQFYALFNITGDPYLSVNTVRNALGQSGVLNNYKAGMTMADLFNTFATAKPAIVLIRYKVFEDAGLTEKHFEGPHFAVGVGMDSKHIYLHDPLYTNPRDGEAHAYPLDLFWKAWTDVAFDKQFPNPTRSAIIPAAGLGYPMERPVVVNSPTLNVRSMPGFAGKVVGSLKKGQVVHVTREVNGWGAIGRDQWISLGYTVPAPQPA